MDTDVGMLAGDNSVTCGDNVNIPVPFNPWAFTDFSPVTSVDNAVPVEKRANSGLFGSGTATAASYAFHIPR